MIMWLTLGGNWLAGFLALIRPSMRRQMLKQVCAECGFVWTCRRDTDSDHSWSGYKQGHRVVRGSKFERDGWDSFIALWVAAWWPVWLLVRAAKALWRALCATGQAIGRSVSKATPLTGPELDRVIEQRRLEIERLTEEINADTR